MIEPTIVNPTPFAMAVMKKFARLNPSLVIEAGDTLRTIDKRQTVSAAVDVGQVLPAVGIFELPRLFAAMDLFPNPVWAVSTKRLDVRDEQFVDGDLIIGHSLCDPSVLTHTTAAQFAKLEARLTQVTAEFELPQDKLEQLLRVAHQLTLPDLLVMGDGRKIEIVIGDARKQTIRAGKLTVGMTAAKFRMTFPVERIEILMPADYVVRVAVEGVGHFVSTDGKRRYFICCNVNGGGPGSVI